MRRIVVAGLDALRRDLEAIDRRELSLSALDRVYRRVLEREERPVARAARPAGVPGGRREQAYGDPTGASC